MIRKNHLNTIQPTHRNQLLIKSKRVNTQNGQKTIAQEEEDKQILLRIEWEMYEIQLRLKKIYIGLQVLHQHHQQYSKLADEKIKLENRLKDLQKYHRRIAGVKEKQQGPEIEQKWKTASRKVQQEQDQNNSKSQYLSQQIREKLEKLSESRKQWEQQLTYQPQQQHNQSLIKKQQDTLKQIDLTNRCKVQQPEQAKDKQQIEDPLILAKHRSRVAEIQLRLAQQNIRNTRTNTLQNELMFLRSRQVWNIYLCQYNNRKNNFHQI